MRLEKIVHPTLLLAEVGDDDNDYEALCSSYQDDWGDEG